MPEVLCDGVTGFIASSVDDLVSAVRRIGDISRRKCREEFENRFAAEVMAANYERIYYQLASAERVTSLRTTASLKLDRPDAAVARYAARRRHRDLDDQVLNGGLGNKTSPRHPLWNPYSGNLDRANKLDS